MRDTKTQIPREQYLRRRIARRILGQKNKRKRCFEHSKRNKMGELNDFKIGRIEYLNEYCGIFDEFIKNLIKT